MKNKKVFAGLALAAIALLAAGCSTTAKSGEDAKAQTSSSKTTKHYKEVDKNKTPKTAKKTAAKTNTESKETQTSTQTGKQDQDSNQAVDNASLHEQIAKDVVSRLGYPSYFDQSDFSFEQTNGVISVRENHNSEHMKAEHADPNVAPTIAHYQLENDQLYYLNFDGTKTAVK